MNRARLELLAREWRTFAAVRALRWVYVAACLAVIVMELFPAARSLRWLSAVVLIASIVYWRWSQSRRFNAVQMGRHLDRTHPELEESSHLWLLSPDSLTLLERLQLARLNGAAERLATASLPTRTSDSASPRATSDRPSALPSPGLFCC